jgi:leader peptidase (prepilin peptidase)/N-methyltransferase
VHTSPFDLLFALFSAVLGAAIGSFLNVCIYRMPRELSVSKPSRSFCPACKYQIPWYHNVPLVSWLVLRGKCANCGSPIAFRYFGVELLTGLLFLAVWLKLWPTDWILAFPYWIMTALFVVATFIDFEHFIIPDEITWGGAVAGVLLSFAIPPLHAHDAAGPLDPWLTAHELGADSHLMSGLWAIVGAVAGYGVLWAVVELGKKAFGKKKLQFAQPEPFEWVRKGLDADLKVGKDQMLWSDFFARGNEQILMTLEWIEIDGKRFEKGAARYTLDWLEIGTGKWKLEETDRIAGVVTEVTFPREAMGMGDVKFLACIGAFLGWKGVVFTVIISSLIGAVIGVGAIATGRREWSAKIPFGPYLALAALLWVFAGPQMVDWYWHLAAGPPE